MIAEVEIYLPGASVVVVVDSVDVDVEGDELELLDVAGVEVESVDELLDEDDDAVEVELVEVEVDELESLPETIRRKGVSLKDDGVEGRGSQWMLTSG